jgi:hypothetical protein
MYHSKRFKLGYLLNSCWLLPCVCYNIKCTIYYHCFNILFIIFSSLYDSIIFSSLYDSIIFSSLYDSIIFSSLYNSIIFSSLYDSIIFTSLYDSIIFSSLYNSIIFSSNSCWLLPCVCYNIKCTIYYHCFNILLCTCLTNII